MAQNEAHSALAQGVERVCTALLYVATAAGILVSCFVALSSFMRYTLGQPFAFTEEIVGLLFATMIYLSLPYCTIHGQHIAVTILTDRYTPTSRRLSKIGSALLVLLFCGWYGAFAWEFVALSWRLHAKSDIGGIVLWPWMSAMLIACVLIVLAITALDSKPVGHGAAAGKPGPAFARIYPLYQQFKAKFMRAPAPTHGQV